MSYDVLGHNDFVSDIPIRPISRHSTYVQQCPNQKIIQHTHIAPYFEYGNDNRPRNFHECPTTGVKYLEVSVTTSWDIKSCPRFYVVLGLEESLRTYC
jgi:hypothetical protein